MEFNVTAIVFNIMDYICNYTITLVFRFGIFALIFYIINVVVEVLTFTDLDKH